MALLIVGKNCSSYYYDYQREVKATEDGDGEIWKTKQLFLFGCDALLYVIVPFEYQLERERETEIRIPDDFTCSTRLQEYSQVRPPPPLDCVQQ